MCTSADFGHYVAGVEWQLPINEFSKWMKINIIYIRYELKPLFNEDKSKINLCILYIISFLVISI